MNQPPPNLALDLVKADEVYEAHKLETAEFPPDEAASLEQFKMRQEVAPYLFLGAFLPPSFSGSKRNIVGYVCATRSALPTLTEESMKKHDPEGSSVCIHAVVVASEYQHRGVALALLKEFVDQLRSDDLTKRALLICHADVRSLYEKAGFDYVGPSPVVHGTSPWHEMRITFDKASDNTGTHESGSVVTQTNDPASPLLTGSLPPGLFEALRQSASSRGRSSARSLSTFPGGVIDVTNDSAGGKTNRYDLVCPRVGCGSVSLKAGVGHLIEGELPQLGPAAQPPPGLLSPLPSPGTSVSCWLVQPSPMAFENIGFSRPVDRGLRTEGPRLKLLSCADCDLGPLGWCIEGGRQFWLLCERVGYRV